MDMFNFILDATNYITFTILSTYPLYPEFLILFEFKRVWMTKNYKKQTVMTRNALGYHVCERKAEHFWFYLGNAFACQSGEIISALFVCDGTNDCFITGQPNKSQDEMICGCIKVNKYCKSHNTYYHCSPLYFKSQDGDCLMYTFQKFKYVQNLKVTIVLTCVKIILL